MQLRNVWRAAGVKSIFERFNERERDMAERRAVPRQTNYEGIYTYRRRKRSHPVRVRVSRGPGVDFHVLPFLRPLLYRGVLSASLLKSLWSMRKKRSLSL